MTRSTLPARSHVSPTARGILDLLSDEQVHDREDVLRAGVAAILAEDFEDAVKEGRRVRKNVDCGIRELAMSGARSKARTHLMIAVRGKRVLQLRGGAQYRMPVALARQWAVEKAAAEIRHPRETVATQEYGKCTYYADIPEWEGWAYAPLHEKDVAHVRLVHTISLKTIRDAFPGWAVTESPEGLVTVAAAPGVPVKDVVLEWLAENEIANEGVRAAKGVRRRNLDELDPEFLHDVIVKSLPLAHGTVAKQHRASMEVLTGSTGDAAGWVNLWVVELATTFDAQLGRPFGTWVRSQIKYKIQDLNRATNGRTASDLEIKFAKVQEALEAESGATPSGEEMAEKMNLTSAEMEVKRAALSQLRAIRSANTLDTSPDAPVVQTIDETVDPERDAVLREQSQRITLALLAASGTYNPDTGTGTLERPLGFLTTYLMEWNDWVKSDLVYLAGCAASRVTKEVEEVKELLKVELADLAVREIPD